MGCGKSKHDVVATTIDQSKKANSDKETDNTKTVKINPEKALNGNISNGNGSLGVVDKVKESKNEKADTKGENVVIESKNKEAKKAGDDDKEKVYVKEEGHEAKDLKGENVDESKKEKVSEVDEGQGQETSISSDPQNDFQEEGTIEGIISEGISGKTAYYSPVNNKVESPKLNNDVIAKENAPVEVTIEETKIEEVEVTEEIPVKEEVAPTTEEAEVPKEIPVKEEALPNTEEVEVTEKIPVTEDIIRATEPERVPLASEEIVAEVKEDEPKTI